MRPRWKWTRWIERSEVRSQRRWRTELRRIKLECFAGSRAQELGWLGSALCCTTPSDLDCAERAGVIMTGCHESVVELRHKYLQVWKCCSTPTPYHQHIRISYKHRDRRTCCHFWVCRATRLFRVSAFGKTWTGSSTCGSEGSLAPPTPQPI